MDVIYYGELDPYSGVAQSDAALALIIEELTLLLLTYDVVIVPPENLFDHRLALLAFEALAPFVRAGRLTTTADRSLLHPRDLVDQRTALESEGRRRAHGACAAPSPRETVAWYRRRRLVELGCRWHEILPATWTLQRDVGAQVGAFAEHLRNRCEAEPARPGSRLLREVLDRASQSGVAPSRSVLLACMAARRSVVAPRDLAEASLLIQIAYFDLGAKAHRFSPSTPGPGTTCRLFPGRFAQFLGERCLAPAADLASTYEPRASTGHILSACRRVGLDATRRASLDPDALFEIASSPEWASLRAFLRGAPDAEPCAAVAATLSGAADLRDALPRLDHILPRPARADPRPSPLLLPSEWQLAVQATLGTALPTPAAPPGFALDLRTRTMTADTSGKTISLRQAEAHLVTLLVLAGHDGLTLADIKQHRFELDRLDTNPSATRLPEWAPQTRENETLDRARLDCVNVLKTRTDKALRSFDLHIDVTRGKGIWRLATLAGGPCAVRLVGSLWALLSPPVPSAPPAAFAPTAPSLPAPRNGHAAGPAASM